MYSYLESRESAKRSGIEWLKRVDNTTFCQAVSPYLTLDFEKKECDGFGDSQFRLGYRSSVFSFMYQFQQNRVKYESDRFNTSRGALLNKRALLNDLNFVKFTIASNVYYQAQMHGLNASISKTLKDFFDSAILFV